METDINKAILGAAVNLLRPLVRILIRHGVAYGAFSEVAKKVYVDVANDEFPPEKGKQSVTRVSALTGLFRRDAKKYLDQKSPIPEGTAERHNRAVRVLSGWLHDPKFHTKNGEPSTLPIEGKRSFATLVQKYSGDSTTQVILKMLKDANCVTETSGGRLKVISHAFVPSSDPVDKINILGTDVAELVATIDHNLRSDECDAFFQRKVQNINLAPEHMDALRKLSAKHSQALLEDLDEWMSEHELNPKKSNEPGRYASLGIYYSEYETPRREDDEN